ncbi:S-layer homology domain-containing protein [Leptolyngbya sp. GB1-A1]|uniref:S-layer homology domain-containing protein n=1 Tax=Leptolyngbya sp. GB1-A1 TaxID=2933908 RepID=UPI003298F0E1
MLQLSRWSIAGVAVITTGLAAGAILPLVPSTAVATSPDPGTVFPDTQGYWAQPFIERLAQQQIVAGYLDGSFQPELPVNRDEYAAILRQAFNQAAERRIPTGSVYQDVPQGYWAASAIEEAYEMGFMQGYPGGYFRPEQGITRAEVLVSLAKNLNLSDAQSAQTPATQPQASNASQTNAENLDTTPQASAIVQPANTRQPTRKARNRRPFAMYPMAMTTLMQPFVASRALARSLTAPVAQTQAATPAATTPDPATTAQTTAPANNAAQPQQPVSTVITNYYADADQIPQYAVDDVARATQAGIVVNYPETNLLNPNRAATRGEVAAFIHQALVDQGRLQPLPNTGETAQFVVKP